MYVYVVKMNDLTLAAFFSRNRADAELEKQEKRKFEYKRVPNLFIETVKILDSIEELGRD